MRPPGLLRLALSSSNPGEVVNLATGRLTTVREFALTAAEVCRIPPENDLSLDGYRLAPRKWNTPTSVYIGSSV